MEHKNYTETVNNVFFEMLFIKGGLFMMGSKERDREQPVHKVTVPNFYLSKYLVTQELWMAVMGEDHNPAYFQGKKRPVEMVSWDDAQAFITRLNEMTGKEYVLPSEACWEYAARGGQLSKGFRYAGSNKLKDVAWHSKNSHRETKPVGLKQPNELGLYDMSGNVWEWCRDVWHENYDQAPDDGSSWMEGGEQDRRVVRGGSWIINFDLNFRVSDRSWDDHNDRYGNIGFRLARYA